MGPFLVMRCVLCTEVKMGSAEVDSNEEVKLLGRDGPGYVGPIRTLEVSPAVELAVATAESEVAVVEDSSTIVTFRVVALPEVAALVTIEIVLRAMELAFPLEDAPGVKALEAVEEEPLPLGAILLPVYAVLELPENVTPVIKGEEVVSLPASVVVKAVEMALSSLESVTTGMMLVALRLVTPGTPDSVGEETLGILNEYGGGIIMDWEELLVRLVRIGSPVVLLLEG